MAHDPGAEITPRQWRDAGLLWQYLRLGHPPRRCDAAIVLGSHDLGVPVRAAELYRAGYFPTVVFSGAVNRTRADRLPRGEAVHFAERAAALGVPAAAILLEPHARNTGENLTLSRRVLTGAGVHPRSVILIAMPYMERRAYATCRRRWPRTEAVCASAPVALDTYVRGIGDGRLVVEKLVGTLQRVLEYPARGFAVEQEVPPRVREAGRRLAADGFTGALIPDRPGPAERPKDTAKKDI
ncbi:YdcF family protein [Kitasatospora sp. MBT63]|uniref:YdcF family protein n=1 Tax=Kitasatospora sp. MBT63 TaxID=1444768 RepID=UPI00068E710E|nr:YdcF family protein [Kitasatospora sp. MBT63]